MVDIKDFIKVIPSDQAIGAAIDYAARSVHFTYDRMGYGAVDETAAIKNRLLRVVCGVLIEQALEEYLESHGIAYRTNGRTHWRKIDVAEFSIGERRVDIKGYHVYPSPGRFFPAWLFGIEGLVPVDQLTRTNAADTYIQAFLIAPRENTSDTHSYVAVLPKSWYNRWREARRIHVHSPMLGCVDISA